MNDSFGTNYSTFTHTCHILVVSEKPSVGMNIAHILGATTKGNGYCSGNGYVVTWCIGHLVRLAMPEEIEAAWEKWSMDTLPMLPDNIPLKLIDKVKQQFTIVKKLINDKRITEIINAGDAGREGEYIQRLVYKMTGNKKPVKRLWVSSMTDEALREGFDNLKDSKEYDNLYHSAECRSQADWIVGLNATRLFSLKYNQKHMPVGRVQTPTLAMVVNRQNEIDHFISKPYYEIEAAFETFKAKWFDKDGAKIDDKKKAEGIVLKCKEKPGKVVSLTKEKKTKERPLLYDLTALQQDANKYYGYTAEETLNTAQALYETHKLTTYPRTDSRYLTADMKSKLPSLLTRISEGYPESKEIIDKLSRQGLNADKHVIDNSKVSDHHAIIVTANIAHYDKSKLNERENRILRLLIVRLLCVLDKKMSYEQTDVEIVIESEHFRSTGMKLIELGWRATEIKLLGKSVKSQQTNIITVSESDTITPTDIVIVNKMTSPPKLYTDASLLADMESAGRKISDADLKSEMKSVGLGTPATRAQIIEKLIKVQYMKRKGKSLIPTEKGKQLISIVPDMLKLPDMTAEWEQQLEHIAKGNENSAKFMTAIKEFTQQMVTEEKSSNAEVTFSSENNAIGKCPRCGKPIYEGTKSFYCSGYKDTPKCEFVLWKNNKWLAEKGKRMTATLAKALLSKPKVLVKNLKSKNAGKTYNAYLSLDDTGKYVNFKMEFADNQRKSKKYR